MTSSVSVALTRAMVKPQVAAAAAAAAAIAAPMSVDGGNSNDESGGAGVVPLVGLDADVASAHE